MASGALASVSFEKTGRAPKDKRIVRNPESENEIWWGPVNIPLEADSFAINRKMSVEFLSECPQLYIVDGYAGWDPEHQLKIRIICARPYHALFMHNMLIRPTAEQLADFGEPDYVILNSGQCKADTAVEGVESDASITLNLEARELVILGSQYAGEMKKGVFTIMHYLMPRQNIFSMHCSANEGKDGTVALFFGLSGTGKTTLSADANRPLIGDDEHCWTDSGVFNIEGGCYAKAIDLSAESEPEIYHAIRFGTVLENVVYDQDTRVVDFTDVSITQNTRVSYPIEYIDNAKIPCVGAHPKNIILLTCDAFGVLPPVSKLSPAQASYHFINGYTAKVAGTEVGVTEPEATFSACFGAAFLMLHPSAYGKLLAEKMVRMEETHPGCLVASFTYESQHFRQPLRDRMCDGLLKWRQMVLDRLARIDGHYEMSEEVSATTVADMFSSIIEGGIILARNFNDNELLAQQILAYRSFIKMIYGIP